MTSSGSLVAQLRAIADEVDGHPELTLLECTIAEPATEAQLSEASGELELTAAMRAFYREADGVRLRWERTAGALTDDGVVVAGSINLLSIEQVFDDWQGIIWMSPDDRFAPLRPIDMFVEEACAALYLDGSPNPQVYYHSLGESMRSLGLDFEGYARLLVKSRGFWYWQQLAAGNRRSQESRAFVEVAPKLFPDLDPAEFLGAR